MATVLVKINRRLFLNLKTEAIESEHLRGMLVNQHYWPEMSRGTLSVPKQNFTSRL